MKKFATIAAAFSLALAATAPTAQALTGTVTGASGNTSFPFEVTAADGTVYFCDGAGGSAQCIVPSVSMTTQSIPPFFLGAGFGGLGLGAVVGGIVIVTVVVAAVGSSTSGTN